MQAGESLPAYFSRPKALWNDLTTCKVVLKEHDVVLSVLAGLPEVYATMVSIIESGDSDDLKMESIL